jgi:hypothetical protein
MSGKDRDAAAEDWAYFIDHQGGASTARPDTETLRFRASRDRAAADHDRGQAAKDRLAAEHDRDDSAGDRAAAAADRAEAADPVDGQDETQSDS